MSIALEATGLTKTYGAVRALDDFSIAIPTGGVFGVLGPNGAGKSTLFRIALGLVRPTSGSARLFGAPAGDLAALRRIGAMIETPRYPPYLTARDTLRMLALESGCHDADINGWLERVGLGGAADRPTNGFSVGMKQRLGLAAAFFTRPELVILDEPFNWLDPVAMFDLRETLRGMVDNGLTLVTALHDLATLATACDAGLMLADGRVAMTLDEDMLQAAARDPRAFERRTIDLLRS